MKQKLTKNTSELKQYKENKTIKEQYFHKLFRKRSFKRHT
jgi:hypothetical protein